METATAKKNSTLTLQGLPVTIEVQRKRIRHMYLYVKPGAHIVISAPLRLSNRDIQAFALSKTAWLARQLQSTSLYQPVQTLEYETGETMMVWGAIHSITFLPDKTKSFSIRNGKIVLAMPGDSTQRERERYVKEQLKIRLRRVAELRMQIWQEQMGLYATQIVIRDMKSRWGSCNTATGKITFNLQLIRLDPVCLDYICVHELAHLKHSNHNKAFWALVETYLPDYQSIRKRLDTGADSPDTEKTNAAD